VNATKGTVTPTGRTSLPQRFAVPHTLVLVMALTVLVLALSWIIPSGEYQRRDIQTSAGVLGSRAGLRWRCGEGSAGLDVLQPTIASSRAGRASSRR